MSVKIKESQTDIQLCNIYAPNEDSADSFENVFGIIEEMNCENIIMGGDFNLALDMEKDKRNIEYKNEQAVEKLTRKMEEYTLVDVWRIKNPEKFVFTWKRSMAMARLDYFLMAVGIVGFCESIEILPGFKSDHSVLQLVIKLEDVVRGQGYWKFNSTLLEKEAFVAKLKIMLDEVDKVAVQK